MKKILITGCNGYIGQHLCKLLKNEYEIYGFDFINGVNKSYSFDYNHEILHDIREEFKPYILNYVRWPEVFDCVIHLAALVRVNESVEQPSVYYNTNVNGTFNVLNDFVCKNFIFASTGAAEYPVSPYALSKRCGEDIVKELCAKHQRDFTIFRFYNVIGSDGIPPTNVDGLFYNLMKAEQTGEFNLYGDDYETRDGSPVRDYVHVNEICHAIWQAIETPAMKLENLGHGIGMTVKEMVDIYKKVNNCNFKVNVLPRRPGDLEYSVLDNPSKYMLHLYTNEELLRTT
jgi:UDP-glucose 4-epimerase